MGPQHLAGLGCLAAVIFLWVGSSELIQFIFDSVDFERPLFLTFYSTSLFSVYLLGFCFCRDWYDYETPRDEEYALDSELLISSTGDGEPPPPNYKRQESTLSTAFSVQPGVRLPPQEVAKLAAAFVPFWFSANWTFNASLCLACKTGTSVASNTIVSSTSSLFTLLLSILFLKESPSTIKFVCVALTFAGVTLVTENDGASETDSSIKGDLLALLGAILFGCYSVLLKRLVPDEESVNMPMFFGFLGVINGVACIPLLLLFHYTGLETFDPVPLKVLAFLSLNGLLGTVLSDLLWARAVVLTSPLTVNVGMSLTIPLSFLADSLNPQSKQPNMNWQYLLGAGLVLCSFVGVNAQTVEEAAEAESRRASMEGGDMEGETLEDQVARIAGVGQTERVDTSRD